MSHPMDLLTPSSPGGLPTLSLTTYSSWLRWGMFAMPLISPLMPVPLDASTPNTNNDNDNKHHHHHMMTPTDKINYIARLQPI